MAKQTTVLPDYKPLARAATDTITRGDVQTVIDAREVVATLKKQLALAEAALRACEQPLIEKLEAGAWRAPDAPPCIVRVELHRYPAWRQLFEAHLGRGVAEVALAQVPPTPHKKLLIGPAAKGGER